MQISQETLMPDYQKGIKQAFDEIYKAYSTRVRAYHLKHSGNLAEAEELTQETFSRLARYASRYNSAMPFENWLFTIAVNVNRDWRRRVKRYLSRFVALTARHREIAGPVPAVGPIALEEAIRRLPRRHREFVGLMLENFKLNAIAGILGCSVRTVQKLKSEAIKMLKTLLADFRESAPQGASPRTSTTTTEQTE